MTLGPGKRAGPGLRLFGPVISPFAHRRLSHAERGRLLRGLIERAGARIKGTPAVLVFDLDGTLIDNRPRTAAILWELAAEWQREHPEEAALCARAQVEDIAYSFVDNLNQLGIHDPKLREEGFEFWKARFFQDPHVRHDIEVSGARDFVRACHAVGANIVYLTGRDLPNMALGSFASLRDLGFPIGVIGTQLVTKPAFHILDSDFKRDVAPDLERLGDVIAVFDNEPLNCNILLDAHPECTAVFVDTQYAPDPPPLDPRAHVIHTFEHQ